MQGHVKTKNEPNGHVQAADGSGYYNKQGFVSGRVETRSCGG